MSEINWNNLDNGVERQTRHARESRHQKDEVDSSNASAMKVPEGPAASNVALSSRPEDQRVAGSGADIRDQLGQAVTRLNDFVQSVQRDLEFQVDDESGRTIVKVVDHDTEEVVRQIPDDLALKLAENLQQEEPLSLLNIKV